MYSMGTSLAHRPVACRESSEGAFLFGWYYILIGNTLQIGDCSVTKTVKFETGDYYNRFKSDIDHEVRHHLSSTEGFGLNDFARSFNCRDNAFSRFHEVVILNQVEIFGSDFKFTPKKVTLSIQKLIDEDPLLSNLCSK